MTNQAEWRKPRARSESLVERALALRDEDAVSWLRGRGLWCEPRGAFHLFADRMVDGPFELLRVWHSPGRLGRAIAPSIAARCETVVQIDGTVSLSDAQASIALDPGGIALLPWSGPWVLDAPVASARIEIRARHGLWSSEVARHRIESLDAVSTAFREVLVATAISALNSTLRPEDPGFLSFRQAVENLVAGLPQLRETEIAAAPGEALRREALDLIEREAADPGLTAASLADRLLVTERRLQRAFAETGATPYGEIRAARARIALQHLELHLSTRGSIGRAEIARRSGFRTVRSMNEALRARA